MPYDYIIPLALFFIVVIGYGYSAGKYLPQYSIIVTILIIAFAPKYAALSMPYYGTEYEDAFVFQADSKNLSEHLSKTEAFRIQVANYNIEDGGNELLAYTGHFSSFSSVVGFVNSLIGYSEYRTIQLNFIFSIILSFVLFSLVFRITNNTYSSLVPVILIATSPATNLFQTSGLTETYSALMIATFLFFLVSLVRGKKISHLMAGLSIASLILCLMIKRENMVLLMFCPLIVARLNAVSYRFWILVLAVFLALYFIFVSPFSTEYLEADSIETNTFSISYLLVQFPVYLKALLTFKYFGVSLFLLITSFLLLAYRRITPSIESMITLLLLLAFIGLYCLHYRSRYFVISMEMSAFETFRYANNFYFLITLIVSLNVNSLLKGFDVPKWNWPLGIIVLVLLGFGIQFSQLLRSDLQKGEFDSRIYPLIAANTLILTSGNIQGDPVLVTDISLVARMMREDDFYLKVSEFDVRKDYMTMTTEEDIFFLLPENLAKNIFGDLANFRILPLRTDSDYTLFQLL
ncbi:MAG: hypothetical protein COB36_09975 [Alphaproteobacteria bacterium]|nr:MAG: hypothetical protein COB36_09975 [Alphaproteobacteria bacterium]